MIFLGRTRCFESESVGNCGGKNDENELKVFAVVQNLRAPFEVHRRKNRVITLSNFSSNSDFSQSETKSFVDITNRRESIYQFWLPKHNAKMIDPA